MWSVFGFPPFVMDFPLGFPHYQKRVGVGGLLSLSRSQLGWIPALGPVYGQLVAL